MNPETKQALHRELTRLRHDVTLGIQSKHNGICYNTHYDSSTIRTIKLADAAWDLQVLCRKWPKATSWRSRTSSRCSACLVSGLMA